jgi:hypothetical protein
MYSSNTRSSGVDGASTEKRHFRKLPEVGLGGGILGRASSPLA